MPEISQQSWDSFVLSQNGSFLQSWAWGEFQKFAGKKVLFIKENNWQALVLIYPLCLGKTYFYIPYGPVWNKEKNNEQIILNDFLLKLKAMANEYSAIFIKIEPKTSDEKIVAMLNKMGFGKAEKSIQPEDTLIIDISRSEQEIFESFAKRCRNEISLADKKKVSLFSDSTDIGIKNFIALLEKTAARDAFRTHPLAYYEALVETLKSANQVDLFFAKIGQDIISGCIVIYFGSTASYVHAASSGPYRAANTLVWTAMREAKKKQCAQFDLYGVAPLNAGENHPWQGLTKFKESFGGNRVHYIGGFDYPISNFWFKLYKLGKGSLK